MLTARSRSSIAPIGGSARSALRKFPYPLDFSASVTRFRRFSSIRRSTRILRLETTATVAVFRLASTVSDNGYSTGAPADARSATLTRHSVAAAASFRNVTTVHDGLRVDAGDVRHQEIPRRRRRCGIDRCGIEMNITIPESQPTI